MLTIETIGENQKTNKNKEKKWFEIQQEEYSAWRTNNSVTNLLRGMQIKSNNKNRCHSDH